MPMVYSFNDARASRYGSTSRLSDRFKYGYGLTPAIAELALINLIY